MTVKMRPSVEEAYRRFLPSELIDMMGESRIEDIVPGGHVEKRMTIMFCDIRDFTGHTDRMSSGECMRFVNSFMGAMEPVIHKGGGVVDKFIGDAVMAVFPGPAEDGVRTAVAMMDALNGINRSRGADEKHFIRAGVGLNTGMALIGAVGDLDRMEPTVVSSAVNLASRLEGLTKTYGVSIIISEDTRNAMQAPNARIRFLDRVRVKGKTQPQSIYEVFEGDPPQEAAGKELTKGKFEEAAAYYHLKEVGRARRLFADCLATVPGDKAAAFYLERCRLFETTGRHEGTGELAGTLAWNEDFEVGIKTIDLQHRKLFDKMNEVAPLIGCAEHGCLGELCKFLADYAVFHFSYEEKLMRVSGYPFINDHIAEHRRFSAVLESFVGEIGAGAGERQFLVFKVHTFLLDWFALHSTGMDRHLGVYLRDPERAKPPA
ncbi:MAG: hypothetical protein A2X32_07310 [Elusimicrobia bacterium GWC2_64_44]|nr:MAG: hypothetical protein A2X32_07310 [Elusimicrobia bacterium GWC2_64_44]